MPKRKQMNASQVAKIAKKVVLGTAETKQVYTEVDEQTVTPGTSGLTINNFLNVSRLGTTQITPEDGSNPKREGAEILPRSFQFRGWMRPRALANDGQPDQQDENFDNALYVRVMFLKTSTLSVSTRTPDNSLTPDDNNFFLGKNGLPEGLSTDYSDIYKPLNWKATGKPLMDKVLFIPNQYKMNNTKLIKFSHKFGQNEKLNFLQNTAGGTGGSSVIPDTTIKMVIIARYANDDIHVQFENLEVSGTGIFKFKDF